MYTLFVTTTLSPRETQGNCNIFNLFKQTKWFPTPLFMPGVNPINVANVPYQPVARPVAPAQPLPLLPPICSHAKVTWTLLLTVWSQGHEATGGHYLQTAIVLTHTERPVQVGNGEV